MRFASVALVLFALTTSANAAGLQEGDVLATSGSTTLHLDSALNLVETFSLPISTTIFGFTLGEDGEFLLADSTSVVQFDPDTGQAATISQGGMLRNVLGIAATDGGIFVTNGFNSVEGLLRIDPATGQQTSLGVGFAFGLAVASNGDLFVALCPCGIGSFVGSVVRVDPVSGEHTLVSSTQNLSLGITTVPGTDDVLVAEIFGGRIVRIDTATGERSVVSEGGLLQVPLDVAVDSSGDILVTDSNRILRIDPATGEQSIAAAGAATTLTVVPGDLPDGDGDGRPDRFDNCPDTPNADQTDTDGNGVGDACNDSEDLDGDEWADTLDNCPDDPNGDQADTDDNNVGDICNDFEDLDADDWADSLDNCPDDFNADQAEVDGDGLGDVCDPYPMDTFNFQGLSDLETAQTTIIGLESDLSSCESDATQCSTDLSQAEGSLITCNGDLSSCIATATQFEVDLGQTQADLLLTQTDLAQTQTDLSQAQADITLLQADVTQLASDLVSTEADLQQTQADLGQTEVELAQTQDDLAVATADTDEDGVRDIFDLCPESTLGVAVDGFGCSLPQFCGGIDANDKAGRGACNSSDWGNDEPGDEAEDCRARQGVCVPLISG